MFNGIIFSIIASMSFAFLYYYTSFFKYLDGNQAFGWRMFMLFPFLTIIIIFNKELINIKSIYKKVIDKPYFFILLMLSSFLSGLQLWLFMWAPMNNKALQVSLGYFILPFILILSGYLFFKEKVSFLQKIALTIALFGVLHEIWRVGSISWESMVVAIGYASYFVLRKKINTDNLGGFWLDVLLMLPISLYFIQSGDYNLTNAFSDMQTLYLVIGLGLISALALGSYIISSRYLPLIIFGLLGYIEPILLVFVSILLGETIKEDEWLTYIPIWIAMSLLVLEGIIYLLRSRKLLAI